ncbi:hypothetical protein [Phenylobacterium sp.]|jgi:hypothetical protein|uniref:hypothetical protein n=1 Tax=Phenylobacterium sp. TaxID=1871053 RepID=UPI0025D282C1|nr:hypothetical protein [Phenylobacterium sp.]MCA6284984.1 hypothetical protein [Phenylobacterium sp.]MCA6288513.1 hypothetical protein [Phenylobacterium sp.]MCA6311122.1 hypothetical protein [Phenylobacterium sp.]MCA6324017.1 hypothetical protein [Phenylobacterium sp.]MCA6336473.1 hypothetical protein [Phenylobacterium sp.]
MQNVQSIRPARPDALLRFDARRPLRPATPEMIEAVIRHADRAERLAGGRLRLRLSEAMAQDLVRQGRLDSPDLRLCDLTVVWDEAQGEVVLVRDDARLREASARWAEWDALWDEASYADPRPPLAALAA